MGALLSRWKANLTTVELLEGLDKDIQTLEEHKEKTQKGLKLWVYRLLLYSALLYLVACTVVYIWYIPEQLMGKLIVASPFLSFPPVVWLLRKMLITLYSKRTERNDEKLKELKAEKKKILEQVMETETYKNAKLILERFDPDSKKRIELETAQGLPPIAPQQGQELRQRHITPRAPVDVIPRLMTEAARPPSTPAAPTALISAPGGPPERNLASSAKHPNHLRRLTTPSCPSATGVGTHPPGPPLVRPVLPRERGTLDKVIEYIVGDGPQNRYALICQQCLSHNGMALKEEFEYIAFRCAYCYFLNPARKTRPQAPHLPEFGAGKTTSLGLSTMAIEKDQNAPASPLVAKSCTIKEEMEAKEQEVTESQKEMEDQPVMESTTKHSEALNQSDNEQEVSAMEVE